MSVGNRNGRREYGNSGPPSGRGRGWHRGGGGGRWQGNSSRRGNRAGVGIVNDVGNYNQDRADNDDDANAVPPNTEAALRVLSVYEHGSQIAFAFYSEDENEIVFEDVSAHTGEETECIVRGVLLETRPNLILVGNKVVANAPLLECLTTLPMMALPQQCEFEQSDDNACTSSAGAATTSIPYQLLKSSVFEPRQCRSAILQKLRVLTLMRHHSSSGDFESDEFARAQICTDTTTAAMGIGLHSSTTSCSSQPTSNFHSLASVIDFDSSTLVRALGSLVIYLRNTAFRLEEGFTVTVNSIRRCPASDSFLRLEEPTLRALRIFATDRHPLATITKSGGIGGGGASYNQKSKEGFSLFALLDRTKSKAGRERLRQWMAKPLRDIVKIQQRHVAIELFLHPECHPIASLLSDRLSAVGRMDSILLRMQRCCAQPNDFLVLGRMLDASYAIISLLGGELREMAFKLDAENRRGEQQQWQQLQCETMVFGVEMGVQLDGTGRHHNHQLQQEYPSVAYLDRVLHMCHIPTIRSLRERIASVVDEESTAEAKDHVVIHFGFHDELDRAKDTFQSLSGALPSMRSKHCQRLHSPILTFDFFSRNLIRSRPAGIVQASISDFAQGCFLATGKMDLFDEMYLPFV